MIPEVPYWHEAPTGVSARAGSDFMTSSSFARRELCALRRAGPTPSSELAAARILIRHDCVRPFLALAAALRTLATTISRRAAAAAPVLAGRSADVRCSAQQLVESGHQRSAARLELGGASSISSVGARRRIPPPRDSCIPTSVRLRTVFLTSSCREISRSSRRPGPLTAARATTARRAARPAIRFPSRPRRMANYIEGGVVGGGSSGDRHMLIIDRDHWLLFETGATRWNATLQPLGGQLRRGVRHESQRSTARHLDVGGCGRPGDLSRPGSLRRGVRRRPRSRMRSASPCDRPTATSGPRRTKRDPRPARCRWACGCA